MGTKTGPRKRLSLFIASNLIPPVAAAFAAAFDVAHASGGDEPSADGGEDDFSSRHVRPLDELAERAAAGERFDALLFSLDLRLDAAAIKALPTSIRALATYSVGTDHVDLVAAAESGRAVFNTPGVLGDSVAENALFLMLGAARRATESVALVRSGGWLGWNPRQLVGIQLAGKKLGILGMGDIGRRVASRAHAMGMEILYCNRRPIPNEMSFAPHYLATPRALVAACDVLLLACPSTEETRGIIDAEFLAAASPDLILVNIARGDLVEDESLIAALREGRIWAAGLDVFAGEPDFDPRYAELPNVFMLPHIGSSTLEARMGMGQVLVDALLGWRAGERPPNQVV